MTTMIINMTPHDVNIIDARGNILKTFEPSGNLIRLSAKVERYGKFGNLPIPKSRTIYGQAEGLPDRADGIYYIVSQLVKNALQYRTDLVVPAEVVRDEKGNIIGCQSLGL